MTRLEDIPKRHTVAFNAIVAASSNVWAQAIRFSQAVETAAMRLAVMTPAHRLDEVKAEVERRRFLFGSELEAMQSVADDLVNGRWQG